AAGGTVVPARVAGQQCLAGAGRRRVLRGGPVRTGRGLPARAGCPDTSRAGRRVAAGTAVRRVPEPQPQRRAGAARLPAQSGCAPVADHSTGGDRTMKGPAPLQRVVYVVSLFPCWSETFIVREIAALVESGVDVRVLSLKPASEDLVHDDAAALLDRVRHPRSLAAAGAALLRTAATRPRVLAGILGRIAADGWRSPRVLGKSLAAL